jgi:electron transfer flavoprotein beta subunit
MRIVCLVKFVPDVTEFKFDHQHQVLIRENVKQILNPDDASALAYALMIKRSDPETVIELVTMAPRTVLGQVQDLLRRNIDQATLISDKRFGGSDTFATSSIIARYLQQTGYDLILTGTHSLDGDTSHVPSQVSELCGLPHMANVIAIEANTLLLGRPEVDVDIETHIMKFAIELPAVLGVRKESGYKLPYVAYQDLDRDVSSQIRVLSHSDLGFQSHEIGLEGSRTRVRRSFVKTWRRKEKAILDNGNEGIETVYRYLKDYGFLS